MNRKPKYFKCSYTPKYQQDYFKLPWYERELMTYFNCLDYNDMADVPDHYLNNIKVVKDYKTVEKDDLKEYPEQDKKIFLSAACRSSKKDLWIKRDLIVEHFKSFK